MPTRWDIVNFAATLLEQVCSPTTPAPEVIPLSSGGLQLEWHTQAADIEIKIIAPFSVEAWVSDPELADDEGETQHLARDYAFLTRTLDREAGVIGCPLQSHPGTNTVSSLRTITLSWRLSAE